MSKTLYEQFCAAMLIAGNTLVKHNAKCAVFRAINNSLGKPVVPADPTIVFYYYVGLRGSVRFGKTYAESRPISEKAKANFLKM